VIAVAEVNRFEARSREPLLLRKVD
jgi:hypothetical protein